MMAPSGGSDSHYLFDVHCDGVFYMRVAKDKKMDYASLCEYLKEKKKD